MPVPQPPGKPQPISPVPQPPSTPLPPSPVPQPPGTPLPTTVPQPPGHGLQPLVADMSRGGRRAGAQAQGGGVHGPQIPPATWSLLAEVSLPQQLDEPLPLSLPAS